MSSALQLALIIFAIVWFAVIIYAIRSQKISIRYSMIWFFAALIIFLVGIFPGLIEWVNGLFHFAVVSNLVIGVLITLLLIITFALTIITTRQRRRIDDLTQEISIIKSEQEKYDRK